jgi:DNA-binding LytR/AlgR family response regulator
MNILIIEDETPAYKRLSKLVQEVVPFAHVQKQIDSISTAKQWLHENAMPELVFLDIHLADGSGFDLLKIVDLDCPVIFVTAYNDYAIEAFKTNSIDYLLKPVKREDLTRAFNKVNELKKIFKQPDPTIAQVSTSDAKKEYKKRFLIRFGEHIKTLQVEDIAYCYSENKATYAKTYEGRTYPMDYNLDALEDMLDPKEFFRINRQYIIHLKAIVDMRSYTKARVIVTLQPTVADPPVVSSERAAEFKMWLSGDI